MRPAGTPIGIALAQAAKATSAAFDDAMSRAGGSMPIWLILLALKTHQGANQRELASAVGIQGATLTHHLNGMESAGLVTRRRDPANRRVHIVELTGAGQDLFKRLAGVAREFDRRLRAGIGEDQLNGFTETLGRLERNLTAGG
ncbi:MarR family winged helix-turn-helix transcriptional regulator [Pseudonocardia eucalypti]|uniref:MarR family winged helix-turn-helix transcriptional regulator n=1 Tax=Pseudonocardia eucalypti TaxID=648755 RepID=A0ABP9QR36_9PSEU|nr:MarR family transcriptional regulator for hemolysin [Pseudonocardia eucalypti]